MLDIFSALIGILFECLLNEFVAENHKEYWKNVKKFIIASIIFVILLATMYQ